MRYVFAMSKMQQRVQVVVDAQKVNASALSRKLGKPSNFIARVVGGLTSGGESVEALAAGLKVDAVWLATGAIGLRPPWMSEATARSIADDPEPGQAITDADAMATIGRLTMEVQQLRAEKAALEALRQSLEAQVSDLAQRLSQREAAQSQKPVPARGKGRKS